MAQLSTAAFLVDREGTLIFYNEAAEELLGLRFEEAGAMGPEEWGTQFEPLDPEGREVPVEELPLAVAFRDGREGHSRLRIRSAAGQQHDIEVSALPLQTSTGVHGAIAIFWPVDEGD